MDKSKHELEAGPIKRTQGDERERGDRQSILPKRSEGKWGLRPGQDTRTLCKEVGIATSKKIQHE